MLSKVLGITKDGLAQPTRVGMQRSGVADGITSVCEEEVASLAVTVPSLDLVLLQFLNRAENTAALLAGEAMAGGDMLFVYLVVKKEGLAFLAVAMLMDYLMDAQSHKGSFGSITCRAGHSICSSYVHGIQSHVSSHGLTLLRELGVF